MIPTNKTIKKIIPEKKERKRMELKKTQGKDVHRSYQ